MYIKKTCLKMKIFFIKNILNMDMMTSRVYINLTPNDPRVHSSQSYTESKAILIQKAIRHFLSRKNSKEIFQINPLYDLVEKDGSLYCNGCVYFEL